jgi:hypothetical protein
LRPGSMIIPCTDQPTPPPGGRVEDLTKTKWSGQEDSGRTVLVGVLSVGRSGKWHRGKTTRIGHFFLPPHLLVFPGSPVGVSPSMVGGT